MKRFFLAIFMIGFAQFAFAQAAAFDAQKFADLWPEFAQVLIEGDKEKILDLFAGTVSYRFYSLGELKKSGTLTRKQLEFGQPEDFPLPYFFLPQVPAQSSGFTLSGTDSYIKDSMKFAIAKTNDGKFCFYIRTRDLLARRFFKIYVFDLVDDKMKIVKIVDEAR